MVSLFMQWHKSQLVFKHLWNSISSLMIYLFNTTSILISALHLRLGIFIFIYYKQKMKFIQNVTCEFDSLPLRVKNMSSVQSKATVTSYKKVCSRECSPFQYIHLLMSSVAALLFAVLSGLVSLNMLYRGSTKYAIQNVFTMRYMPIYSSTILSGLLVFVL